MTRTELNSLSMFKAVELFFSTNKVVLTPFNALTTAGAQINLAITEIEALGQTQSQSTKVDSELKSIERSELNAAASKVIAALGAEAVATQNNQLRITVEGFKIDLNRLREADFLIRISAIHTTAVAHATELEKWGATAADIEMLNTTASSFAGRSTEIRGKSNITKQASTEIKEKISTLSTYLRNDVDTLMEPFATLNPTLYGQYKNARIKVDRAATQTTKPDADAQTEAKSN